MDARTSQGPAAAELPRNLFFGAEDWVAQQPDITDANLALVRNQRHVMVGHATHKAEKLLAGLRALKDFDATGNAGSTLDHLEALRDDLAKLATNLIHDIEDAEARYELARQVVIDEATETSAAAEEHPAANVRTPEGLVLHVSEAPHPGHWLTPGSQDKMAKITESYRAGR